MKNKKSKPRENRDGNEPDEDDIITNLSNNFGSSGGKDEIRRELWLKFS